MAKLSEVFLKAQANPVLLMDLMTDVGGALDRHGIKIDEKDMPELKAAIVRIKADLAAELTRLQVSYAEEGRWGGVGGVGLAMEAGDVIQPN